ncbi:hypothetical protein [Algoriphagus ratkowskyi]|uniref:Transposase n=1 Tax=Algoriphagus ratkowskyi TaxID=57028 RepID=A0ABY3HMS6_9BACT|nr:hypothetical protein [Algoriphagus ratkowskyi]TXD77640.1 hypothetical protein ESW18_09690 [Algoriphagus ratkowskyi]
MKRQKEKRTRGIGSLSWAEREEMIKEYLSGNYSKIEIWKKYTGQSVEHGKMLQWMRELGYSDKIENPIKRLTCPELSLHKVNYNETTKRKKNKGHRISELG